METGRLSITRVEGGSIDERIKIEMVGDDGKIVLVYMAMETFARTLTGLGNQKCEYMLLEGKKAANRSK